MAAGPARFSSWASKPVSNDCNRGVSAAPRSQILFEPISRNVGSCDATVDGLAQQVRQRKWRVLPASSVGQVLGDEIAEAQTFVQLTHQNQATIGGARDPWKSTFRELLKER
jgi:hypothetical protein